MKAIPMALAAIMVSLGIVAGAVFGLGDDAILTQPPERAAEEFARAVALGQVGAARAMLSRDAEHGTPNGEVRRIADEFRARLGRLKAVQGRVVGRRRDTAVVRLRVEGERRDGAPLIALVREYGAWSVAHASDVLVVDDATAENARR